MLRPSIPSPGTIGGCRVRTRLVPAGSGWVLTLAPKRLGGMGIAIGDDVTVELVPEGPQRGDLADDIAAALEADPAAGAFFDTLAQFYRKAYLRWIDATTRRPELRAARIAEVTGLLAAGIKERPRSCRRVCPGWIIVDPSLAAAGGAYVSQPVVADHQARPRGRKLCSAPPETRDCRGSCSRRTAWTCRCWAAKLVLSQRSRSTETATRLLPGDGAGVGCVSPLHATTGRFQAMTTGR